MKLANIPYKWLALLAVSFGTFMNTLDSSIVMISLPRLSVDLNTSTSVVLWVVVAFTLVSVCLMFPLGRIGDFVGRKKVFVAGLVITCIGLAFCSVSQNITQLILSRVVQAIGSSMIGALDMAIVTAASPTAERGKAIGILTGVVSAGLLLGPIAGGFLVESLGWQSIFYIRIPVGIVGAIVCLILLKEQKNAGIKLNFDWAGAVTLSGGLALLLLYFNRGATGSFISLPVLLIMAGSLVLFSVFVITENRISQPLLDLRLLRNRSFTAANISLLIMFATLISNSFLMPFYLIQGLGYTVARAGLLYAVYSAVSLVVAPFAGWLSDKVGYRVLCTSGIVVLSLGLFLLSRCNLQSSELDILWRLSVIGIGTGLFLSPNNSAIFGSVASASLSTGGASIATVRQVGISAGTAIAGALFASREAFHLANQASSRAALVAGFQDAQLVMAFLCTLGVFAMLAQGKMKDVISKID